MALSLNTVKNEGSFFTFRHVKVNTLLGENGFSTRMITDLAFDSVYKLHISQKKIFS